MPTYEGYIMPNTDIITDPPPDRFCIQSLVTNVFVIYVFLASERLGNASTDRWKC